MKQALHFTFDMAEPGGGQVVAAWAAQALLREYHVTLIAWSRPDLDIVDVTCGTRLAKAPNLTVLQMPAPVRRPFACQPLRLALLRRALLERWVQKLVTALDPAVVVSTSNETDLGRPLVQYIHYPWALYPRPRADLRWYHLPPLQRFYGRLAERIDRFDPRNQEADVTLANSHWTAERYRACYGLPARVLYPPVPVEGAGADWSEREEAFVVVGRISPEKRLIEAIRVLSRVRAAGRDVTLRICGRRNNPAYLRALQAEIAAAGPWVTLQLDLGRSELIEQIGRCRYGLHMMIDEHFGITVAEMLRLGCLPFVHRSGGPLEILREVPLHFESDEDAVRLILERLSDPAGVARLRREVAARDAGFGTEAFMTGLLACCAELEARGATDAARRVAPVPRARGAS